MVRKVEPVADIISELVTQAEEHLKKRQVA